MKRGPTKVNVKTRFGKKKLRKNMRMKIDFGFEDPSFVPQTRLAHKSSKSQAKDVRPHVVSLPRTLATAWATTFARGDLEGTGVSGCP